MSPLAVARAEGEGEGPRRLALSPYEIASPRDASRSRNLAPCSHPKAIALNSPALSLGTGSAAIRPCPELPQPRRKRTVPAL